MAANDLLAKVKAFDWKKNWMMVAVGVAAALYFWSKTDMGRKLFGMCKAGGKKGGRAAGGKATIRLYYAPWCGWSKKIMPEWDAFASNPPAGVSVVKIDCTQDKDTCEAAKVRGYPTVEMTVGNGDPIPFSGERTQDGLRKFAAAHA